MKLGHFQTKKDKLWELIDEYSINDHWNRHEMADADDHREFQKAKEELDTYIKGLFNG